MSNGNIVLNTSSEYEVQILQGDIVLLATTSIDSAGLMLERYRGLVAGTDFDNRLWLCKPEREEIIAILDGTQAKDSNIWCSIEELLFYDEQAWTKAEMFDDPLEEASLLEDGGEIHPEEM